MSDEPGFYNIVSGVSYTLDLVFAGALIDTSANDQVLVSRTWTVQGSTTAMVSLGEDKRVRLGPTDRILGAYLRRNAESGALEVHIVVTRPLGLPPLDPIAVQAAFIDASGRLSAASFAPPLVHEVGGRGRSTASIVYTLPPGAGAPAKVELALNGGLVTLNVQVDEALTATAIHQLTNVTVYAGTSISNNDKAVYSPNATYNDQSDTVTLTANPADVVHYQALNPGGTYTLSSKSLTDPYKCTFVGVNSTGQPYFDVLQK